MRTLVAAASLAATLGMYGGAAHAASIDMNDPNRAKGRENDVRIDAQLVNSTLASGSPIAITWQIQNFSLAPVAVATRVVDASYDAESRTITLSIGSEVPDGGKMPAMVVVAPGAKRVFRAAAVVAVSAAALRAGLGGAPRLLQVKVSILRDLDPFAALIERQTPAVAAQSLPDALFEQWFESTDTIILNTLPVQWAGGARQPGSADESRGRF